MELRVHTAFSRDQLQKIYIQDIIRKEGILIKKLIDEGAVVVVCGSSGAMPRAVREALLDALSLTNSDKAQVGEGNDDGGEPRREAEALLKGMEDGGRFVQETW